MGRSKVSRFSTLLLSALSTIFKIDIGLDEVIYSLIYNIQNMSDNTKNSFVIDQIDPDDPDLQELKEMKIKLQISKKKKELKKKNFLAKNPVVSKLQSKLDAKSESKPNPEPEQPVQKKEPEQPVKDEPKPFPEPVKKMPEPEPVMGPVRANSSGKWLVL
jgi:hypothetical protein